MPEHNSQQTHRNPDHHGGMATADRRILVVDDERSITDLVTMALHLQGATVEVAHSGPRPYEPSRRSVPTWSSST